VFYDSPQPSPPNPATAANECELSAVK